MVSSTACATTLQRTWDDQHASYLWRGGEVAFAREESPQDRTRATARAMGDARKWCGPGREPTLKALAPFQKYDSGWSPWGPKTEYTWYERHLFFCADPDPVDGLFELSGDTPPACRPIPPPFMLGRARYEAYRAAPSSQVCDEEGWLRIARAKARAILFVGPRGLQTCRAAAARAAEENISGDAVPGWLHAHLTGPSP